MKINVFLFILSFFFISITTFAQQRQVGTPEERATRQTDRMKQSLNLSPEQETTVGEINLKFAKQAQPLLETGGRNLKTLRQARSIMKAKDEEIEKVLNKDQFSQYEKIRKEIRNEFRERRRQQS